MCQATARVCLFCFEILLCKLLLKVSHSNTSELEVGSLGGVEIMMGGGGRTSIKSNKLQGGLSFLQNVSLGPRLGLRSLHPAVQFNREAASPRTLLFRHGGKLVLFILTFAFLRASQYAV